ncbi:hypothetical protein BCU68_05325 [Vibrio sp. 10N.286.49.B3]|nr:hypothetical protein BCU68_05325 [Vibrio sp. 10N.286.49.B3]
MVHSRLFIVILTVQNVIAIEILFKVTRFFHRAVLFFSLSKALFTGKRPVKYDIKRARLTDCCLFLAMRFGNLYLIIFKSHTFRHMFRGASTIRFMPDRLGVGFMGSVEA